MRNAALNAPENLIAKYSNVISLVYLAAYFDGIKYED